MTIRSKLIASRQNLLLDGREVDALRLRIERHQQSEAARPNKSAWATEMRVEAARSIRGESFQKQVTHTPKYPSIRYCRNSSAARVFKRRHPGQPDASQQPQIAHPNEVEEQIAKRPFLSYTDYLQHGPDTIL